MLVYCKGWGHCSFSYFIYNSFFGTPLLSAVLLRKENGAKVNFYVQAFVDSRFYVISIILHMQVYCSLLSFVYVSCFIGICTRRTCVSTERKFGRTGSRVRRPQGWIWKLQGQSTECASTESSSRWWIIEFESRGSHRGSGTAEANSGNSEK
jgi:hypothetical protein